MASESRINIEQQLGEESIELKKIIPQRVRDFQEREAGTLSRTFSNLSRNPTNRPKLDILTDLAEEGYTSLYEQMEEAISEHDEIQAAVVKKTRELNVGKFEATFEVYVDQIVKECGGSVNEALLWVIDEKQNFRELCTEVFVIRLLDRGANIRYSNPDGDLNTPLHLAAKRGFSNVARRIIERDLFERGRRSTLSNTGVSGIVHCTNKERETPLEIVVSEALRLATEDAHAQKTVLRQLGLVKVKKKCDNHCKFAKLIIKNMEVERVRRLFQADNDDESRLSLHELLEYSSLTDLTSAVLDAMCEPIEGNRQYRIHYSILEGDEKGYPPDHKEFQLGSRRSCLYKIAKSQNKKLVYHDVVRLLLRKKWRLFARTIFWLQFIWYLLVFIFLTVALVLAAKTTNPKVYNTQADYFRLFCEVFLFLTVIMYNGFAEIRQMVFHKWYYLLDRFNFIDVPAVVFTILIIPFRITGDNAQWIFAALSYLFNGIRAFKYASVNQLTGAYVQIIFRILLQDILRFGIVSLALFLSFSGTFYFALRSEYNRPQTILSSLQNDSNTADTSNISTLCGIIESTDDRSNLFENEELYEVWLIGFRVVIEGPGAFARYFPHSNFQWFGTIIYLAFIFVMIVLLLNLLIAQMSNTYSTILNEAQYAMLLNRAWIVARVEHNSFFGLILLYADKLSAKLRCCRRNHSQTGEADGSNTVTEQRNIQMRFYKPYEDADPQEKLEKWDVPQIDVVRKKLEDVESDQRKLLNVVMDMRTALIEKLTEIQRNVTTGT